MTKRALVLFASLLLAFPAAAQIEAPAGAAAVAQAPLVGPAALPPTVSFGLTQPQMREAYRSAQANLDASVSAILAAPASFANTVKAYEQANADYARAVTPLAFLGEVSPDPAVRRTAQAISKVSDRKSVELSNNEALYRKIEEAAARGETLDPADARLMEDTVKGWRESGFSLPAEQRARLAAIQLKLNNLSAEFARNISDKKDTLVIPEGSTSGLPAGYLAGLARAEDGSYLVPVDEPNNAVVMRSADSAEVRREMLARYNGRGGSRNLEVLHESLSLRREMARLLGYPGYPEMALRHKMAKTPQAVYEFLGRLKDAVLDRARRDAAELLEMKRRDDPAADKVAPWERAYYSRKLRESRYALDGEEVKQYFPLDRVVAGTLSVYQRTLGLNFREVAQAKTWAPGVRLFEVSDAATGRLIGHFYLDLTPRPGKHGHPAAFPLVSGRVKADGSYDAPVSAMVADFPTAEPGKPVLLNHGDVETFFHEFGHLMHGLLTQARYSSYSGTSVARDFVEAPSQMLENFVWERPVLAELSGRWDDGSPLPDALYAKMLAARDFQSGAAYAGQIALAMGDMILHATVPDDVNAAFNKILEDYTGYAPLPGSRFVAAFGHLLGGYGAGYYGYLWSKVFAQDIYSVFRAAGVISPEVGARYRAQILAWGSERPEEDSLRAFLGREPNAEAFMRGVRAVPAP